MIEDRHLGRQRHPRPEESIVQCTDRREHNREKANDASHYWRTGDMTVLASENEPSVRHKRDAGHDDRQSDGHHRKDDR